MSEELKQALQVIRNVAAVYRGDLKEHTLIQDSIRLIEQELTPKEVKTNEEPKKK